MRFRPCIDIHGGKVKQIVGGTLSDSLGTAEENFVSEQDGAYYGRLYKSRGLTGGHIILLDPSGSEAYEKDMQQAFSALREFEGGMQLGGGVNADNAKLFLDAGASHVIVTSYVFKNGEVNEDNLAKLIRAVGRKRLVLDLSCRRRDGEYFIVTDRWQKFTNIKLDESTLDSFSRCCSELLVHAVDVEGKASGIEEEVAKLLAESPVPATYAGGIASYGDIEKLRVLGQGRVDFTVGSALDIFGGKLSFEKIAEMSETEDT